MFAAIPPSPKRSSLPGPFREGNLLTSASPLGYAGNDPNAPLSPYPITFAAYAPPGGGDAEVKKLIQTVFSGPLTVQLLTFGRPAAYDMQIAIPPGQNQGPFMMGAMFWQEVVSKAMTEDGVDLTAMRKVGSNPPEYTFPASNSGRSFIEAYTPEHAPYYWQYPCTDPNTGVTGEYFFFSCPYAITFQYQDDPNAPFKFTIREKWERWIGAPDGNGGVTWPDKPTKVSDWDTKMSEGMPLPATNDNVGQEKSNFSFGILKRKSPSGAPLTLAVLTDAPGWPGTWSGRGAYQKEHVTLQITVSNNARVSKTFQFDFWISRVPAGGVAGVVFTPGTLTEVDENAAK
jgi:hypothetical protein